MPLRHCGKQLIISRYVSAIMPFPLNADYFTSTFSVKAPIFTM